MTTKYEFDENTGKMTLDELLVLGDIVVIGDGLETKVRFKRLITAGDSAAGFFVLPLSPVNAGTVDVKPAKGPMQINQSIEPGAGDFAVLNTTELHFNNNGTASGLSEDINVGKIVYVIFEV